jgi:hypothetical protein
LAVFSLKSARWKPDLCLMKNMVPSKKTSGVFGSDCTGLGIGEANWFVYFPLNFANESSFTKQQYLLYRRLTHALSI